ncbi:MAG: Gfo/Idh/MocA family protein [Lachnospirales bacterium]
MAKDGMSYAPKGKPSPVVKENEFIFAVAYLNHGHIYGMTNGLIEAGATIKYVYDTDEKRVEDFLKAYPQAKVAKSFQEILGDGEINLVASAAITNKRADVGMEVMEAGKNYFVDKAPFTTLEQIEKAKKVIEETKKRYFVYYSELIHVEAAVHAKGLIDAGVIGDVIQVLGLGPHRLNAKNRPDWFFKKGQYGGILCDIGSHNIYQFLEYANIDNAEVVRSNIGNFNNPNTPELDDFGEAMLVGENGSSHYLRVDWFTPDGLSTWGDGRVTILGTKGYIEMRKYCDVGKSKDGNNIIIVTGNKEEFVNVSGKVGFPFFGQLILDIINNTEVAQSQHRALKASELSIIAQNKAVKIK